MAVGPVVADGRRGSSTENGCCGGYNVCRCCCLSGTMHMSKKEGERQVQQSQMWWSL